MKGASHESLGTQQTKGLVMPMNQSKRFWVRFGSVCVGILVVVVLNLVPLRFPGLDLSMILADWRTMIQPDGSETSEHHWFAVQAFLWITFFLGLGEIWIRRQGVRSEEWLLKIGLLPEDERTMLTSEKLAPIYVRARTMAPDAMLSTLVRRLTMEFRKSVSVDRVNSLLDSSLELLLHQLDLRYTLLRYLVWIIPTLGFLGTVIGIADALEFVGRIADADNRKIGCCLSYYLTRVDTKQRPDVWAQYHSGLRRNRSQPRWAVLPGQPCDSSGRACPNQEECLKSSVEPF
jgi:hypothetical protein